MHIPYIQVLLIQVTWVFLFLFFFFTLLCIKWVPDDPEIIFLATSFTQKNTERSDFKYSSILMLENIWYRYFTLSVSNSQKIVNSFQFSLSPQGLINEKRLTISCEFGPLQVKWYVFWHKKGGIYGIWAFWHFLSKSGHQEFGAWDPMPSFFGSVMPLFKETYKFFEPNYYIWVIPLLSSTLVWIIWRKSHFV